MKIYTNNNHIYSPNFCAKNRIIREADDIVRLANNCYPRLSATLVDGFKIAKKNKFTNLKDRLYDKIHLLRTINDENIQNIYYSNSIKLIKNVPNTLKKLKCGNCRESSELAILFAKINGIDNAQIVHLKTAKGKDLDHAIVLVKGKKPYIIDAWLGFADYVPKAIERYKKEFNKHFDKRMLKSKKFIFAEPSTTTSILINELVKDKRIINELKLNFPEWIIKK